MNARLSDGLTALHERAVRAELDLARALGATSELVRQHRELQARLGASQKESDFYRRELGDLRDGVDELTRFRGAALSGAIADLRGERESDGCTEPDLEARDVFVVGR